MPAVSKAQQRFFGMVRATQKGEMASPSSEVAQAASSMSKSDVKKFAKTKHKGLPDKKEVKEADMTGAPSIKDAKPQKKTNVKYYKGLGYAPTVKAEGYTSADNAERIKRYDAEKKKFARADKRMKFGKFAAKAKEAQDRLRPGEVKRWDKEKKKWVSNKD